MVEDKSEKYKHICDDAMVILGAFNNELLSMIEDSGDKLSFGYGANIVSLKLHKVGLQSFKVNISILNYSLIPFRSPVKIFSMENSIESKHSTKVDDVRRNIESTLKDLDHAILAKLSQAKEPLTFSLNERETSQSLQVEVLFEGKDSHIKPVVYID